MPDGQVLEFSGVTKRFGSVVAVDGLSARIEPGVVTGFLGPNGAGKTTALRMLLGLVRPTAGTATIGGVPYRRLERPLQTVGAALEASSFHPGRSAANHLKVYAQASRLPVARVDEALGLVGLADVAGRKVGGYSLGMRQRLGLAYTLLGDPGVLVLDEPANGLDPEGIRWMRGLLRELSRQGRTVLVSSHLLSEIQQTADSLVIISRGRLVFQGGFDDLSAPEEQDTVVDAPDRDALAAALTRADLSFELLRSGLTVRAIDPALIGRIAADAGIALSTLQRRGPALEEVFLELVNGTRVHDTAGRALGGVDTGAGAAERAAATETAVPVAAPGTAVAVIAAAPEAETSGPGRAASDALADDASPDATEVTDPGATYSVAATGVIDIVPSAGIGEHDGTATEADDPGTVDPERPWERYVKTEADREADQFFAAFNGGDAETAGEPDAAPAGGADRQHPDQRESAGRPVEGGDR